MRPIFYEIAIAILSFIYLFPVIFMTYIYHIFIYKIINVAVPGIWYIAIY